MKVIETLLDQTVDIFSEAFPLPSKHDVMSLYTVHPTDVEIMSQLDIKQHNAVVAGGAALRWYQNLPVGSHDIDIWCQDVSSMNELEKRMQGKYALKFSSANAQTYEIHHVGKDQVGRDYRVQLIKPHDPPHESVQSLIERFDITVCQVATDGVRWWTSDTFVPDLLAKRLRFTKYTPKTVRRLVKYWSYGFNPDTATLEAITTDPQILWNYESSGNDDYDNIM